MDKTSVVLVGCGKISDTWLRTTAVKKRVHIVGMVDIRHEAADACKEQSMFPNARTGTNLAAMLRATRPDAVFDCTVPEAHYDVTRTALGMGCHVLGEKPMSDSMPRARRMLAAARKAGKIYAVMQNRRYQKGIRALKKFLEGGAIGKLVAVHSDFFVGPHFGGFRDVMDHVLLLDMAIHTFDQARFITGRDALNVTCHEWTPPHAWYRHGPSAVAIFEMSGRIVYTYRGSWCAEGCATSWESNWRIIGEQGTLCWDGADGFRCETLTGDTGFIRPVKPVKVPVSCPPSRAQGHRSGIDAFLDAVHHGNSPETVCTDNIKSLAMVHAAVHSATNRRCVRIRDEEIRG